MSRRYRDRGHQISALAERLTPGQLAELLAIETMATMLGHPTATHRLNWHADDVQPLVRLRLITWTKDPPGGFDSQFRGLELTKLGRLVMLCRVERELQHVLPQYESREPE